MGEIIFNIILLVVLGLFFKESFSIETARTTDPIGPAGFPQAIIAICFVFLLISLYQAIRKYRNRDQTEASGKPAELSKEFIGILAVISIYLLIVDYLGFILTTFAFFIVLYALFGRKMTPKNIVSSLLFSFGFTLVFGTLLDLQLPRGIELLKNLSYWIY
ncbi:tripartite tricarboxylate transporter TctB family protein [Brevibacillus composti]|uniref:Tripartite tricarboxylate transporter TctB family protein n=1 Tax=Brevibacillus composti TaxID=2796470 RepID=A0A7T5EI38_9BACL|nr:tripartite tricarboxylate transporter TctB family protein [Brevibacillus composti]QQE73042.1 tripartite tricarboxylate transporter TctB family protein [Brevibacillus composti]QUO40120.1 tripartite tricarboxylate transporter TctB family protein [Brevibacillus composti]